jgi:hypothetical protein
MKGFSNYSEVEVKPLAALAVALDAGLNAATLSDVGSACSPWEKLATILSDYPTIPSRRSLMLVDSHRSWKVIATIENN